MNTYVVIFGFLLCTVIVNARNFGERTDSEDERDEPIENTRKEREHGASQMRHRRRSWQMNYGYDYSQPPNQYYSNRRGYDQQDVYPEILRLLDEISAYVKRPTMPPPPPQPVYVPYPVPYPVPQYCSCPTKPSKGTGTNQNPALASRFPEMEDTNQNWGFAINQSQEPEDDGDGSRPISFVPIIPKRPGTRSPPKVEHGSTQAGSPKSVSVLPSRKPSECDVASLSCCNGSPEEQMLCFHKVNCASTYDNGNGCKQDRLLAIIDSFSKAYAPVN